MTTPDDALAWLRSQGRVQTTIVALASAWGWSRSTAAGRLKRWAAEGFIHIERRPRGTVVTWIGERTAVPANLPALLPAPQRWSRQLDLLDPIGTTYVAMRSPQAEPVRRRSYGFASEQTSFPVADASIREMAPVRTDHEIEESPKRYSPLPTSGPSRRMRLGDGFLVVVIAALTTVMLYISIRLNAWYAESRGATPEAKELWVYASMSAELFEAVMALAGARLSLRRQWGAAILAYSTCGAIMVFATLAAIGFAATNIADTNAGRQGILEQRQALETGLDRDRQALAGLPPGRTPDVVAAALQQAQPKVPPSIWRSTKGCSDVTAPQSGEACAEVLRLRQEEATGTRRDALLAAIGEAESRRAALPPITAADPQAEAAATVINWITRGAAGVTVMDIQLLFLVLVVLIVRLPVSVGPIVAVALWRPERHAAGVRLAPA